MSLRVKHFSDDEKQLIHIINAERRVLFGNLIYPHLERTSIWHNAGNGSVVLRVNIAGLPISPSDLDWVRNKISQLEDLVLSTTTLLSYLERNGLVTTFLPAPRSTPERQIGQLVENDAKVEQGFPDPAVASLLGSYLDKEIISTPDLQALERNDFLGFEEMRFRRQYAVTWGAITVALLVGLTNVVFHLRREAAERRSAHHVSDTTAKLLAGINQLTAAVAVADAATSSLSQINGSIQVMHSNVVRQIDSSQTNVPPPVKVLMKQHEEWNNDLHAQLSSLNAIEQGNNDLLRGILNAATNASKRSFDADTETDQ